MIMLEVFCNQINITMCFVKSLIHKKTELESAFKPTHLQKSPIMQQNSTPCQVEETKKIQKDYLCSLFQSLLITNSMALASAEEKVDEIILEMQNVDQQVKKLQQPPEETPDYLQELHEVQPLIETVFGKKVYKYKLEIEGDLPEVLYKQRNFNLDIKLTDFSGNPVRNANLIPLCLGAITTTAEWINENRQGETLIKGKSQVQLYKGKAEFLKIYLREVSRPYPDGKINLAIYAKPSMMKYLNHTALEQKVNEDEIMPLIIKDVSVRAKKK